MTITGVLPWPLLPRDELVARATAPLLAAAGDRGPGLGATVGVVLVGETGVGKTTTALAVARAASAAENGESGGRSTPVPDARPTSPETGAGTDTGTDPGTGTDSGADDDAVEGFVRLRGSALAATMPYGLLFGLMKSAGADVFTDSAAFHAAFTRTVAVRSRSKRPIVVVDNAGLCDALSAHALSQLAVEGSIRLLLAVTELGDLPEAFLELWRDGLLPVVEVAPLETAEVAELLAASLNAPIVPAAALYLAERSGGNPLFLNYLVVEQLESGLLVQTEGRWVLTGPASLSSDRLVGMLKTRIDQWSPEQREVLEIVALMDGIGLEQLEALVEPDRIAELLDAGVLEMADRERLLLRVANSLIAEVVRASVPFLRRRQLRTRMAPLVIAPEGSPVAGADAQRVLAFSVWTLECGAALEPEIAVSAARAANRLFDPEFAIRVASTVKDGPLAVAAAVQKSRALRTLGRPAHAAKVLTRALAAAAAGPLEAAVEFAQELARVDGAVPGFDGFDRFRQTVARRITLERHGAEARALWRRLELAEWSLLLRSGDYVTALDRVQHAVAGLVGSAEGWSGELLAPDDADPDHTDYTVRCLSMLAECLSAVGRQDEALAIAAELLAVAEHAGAGGAGGGVDAEALDEVREALAVLYLRTGRWLDRRALIANPPRGVLGRDLYRGSGYDGAVGVGHLFGGSSRLGRDHLMSALSQLRLRDIDNGRGEILAALAYSSALDGDLDLARGYLEESRTGATTNWSAGASATYLALNAEALLEGRRDEAVDRMLEIAEQYRARGQIADALLLTSSAARLGSARALERLSDDRMPQPGPLARAVYTWVDAERDGDLDGQLDAAEALLVVGNELFAREIAARVVAVAPPALIGRAAEVLRRADLVLGAATAGVSAPAVSRFDALTRRERDVAELVVDGLSNRDIAARLHLSVRTVESYLQSAFGKLGVSNRRELTQLGAAAG